MGTTLPADERQMSMIGKVVSHRVDGHPIGLFLFRVELRRGDESLKLDSDISVNIHDQDEYGPMGFLGPVVIDPRESVFVPLAPHFFPQEFSGIPAVNYYFTRPEGSWSIQMHGRAPRDVFLDAKARFLAHRDQQEQALRDQFESGQRSRAEGIALSAEIRKARAHYKTWGRFEVDS
jgi:hypothetical protein